MLIRKVKLISLTDILTTAAESSGADAVEEAYKAYKATVSGASDHTVGEAIALAYAFLRERKAALALKVFELNAESYPNVAAALYNLGEGHRFMGQSAEAKDAYERTVAVDPDHALAKAKLAEMRP